MAVGIASHYKPGRGSTRTVNRLLSCCVCCTKKLLVTNFSNIGMSGWDVIGVREDGAQHRGLAVVSQRDLIVRSRWWFDYRGGPLWSAARFCANRRRG